MICSGIEIVTSNNKEDQGLEIVLSSGGRRVLSISMHAWSFSNWAVDPKPSSFHQGPRSLFQTAIDLTVSRLTSL
jgi:hypothetical protein